MVPSMEPPRPSQPATSCQPTSCTCRGEAWLQGGRPSSGDGPVLGERTSSGEGGQRPCLALTVLPQVRAGSRGLGRAKVDPGAPPPPQGEDLAWPLYPHGEPAGPCLLISKPGTRPKLTKDTQAHHRRPRPPPGLRHGYTYLPLGQAFKAVVHDVHRVALGDAGTHRRAHGRVHASRWGPHVQDGQGEAGLQRRWGDKSMSPGSGRGTTDPDRSQQRAASGEEAPVLVAAWTRSRDGTPPGMTKACPPDTARLCPRPHELRCRPRLLPQSPQPKVGAGLGPLSAKRGSRGSSGSGQSQRLPGGPGQPLHAQGSGQKHPRKSLASSTGVWREGGHCSRGKKVQRSRRCSFNPRVAGT